VLHPLSPAQDIGRRHKALIDFAVRPSCHILSPQRLLCERLDLVPVEALPLARRAVASDAALAERLAPFLDYGVALPDADIGPLVSARSHVGSCAACAGRRGGRGNNTTPAPIRPFPGRRSDASRARCDADPFRENGESN